LVFWKCYEVEGPYAPEPPAAPPREGPIPHKLEPDEHIQDLGDAASPGLTFAATGLLLAGIVALTIFAGPVMRFAGDTAHQLHDASAYLDAVLYQQEGTK
ncbi:MAG: monovalent cation/H+ antiporter subunit D, partial [Paracoccus sp.]|nr:monovalent cation/H+ antiporter subunit D [Paracoccus sp. (in: a-proteobacteria)]